MEYCEKDLIEWIKKEEGTHTGDLGRPVCAQDNAAKVRDELEALLCPKGYDGTKQGRVRRQDTAKWRATEVGRVKGAGGVKVTGECLKRLVKKSEDKAGGVSSGGRIT